MADIFISYSNQDREAAKTIASTLEKAGFVTWWDSKIQAGDVWDQIIEKEIRKSEAVLVLWSENSAKREWIKQEAIYANELGKLIPARIDDANIPLAFNLIHTQDLRHWRNGISSADAMMIRDAIAAIRRKPMTGIEKPMKGIETPLLVDHRTIPAPRAGYTLVAIGRGPPKEITDYRVSLTERLLRRYSFVEVNISLQEFEEVIELPSGAPSINFDAEIRVTYRVKNPILMVKGDVRSTWARIRSELYPKITQAIRGVLGNDASPNMGRDDAFDRLRSLTLADVTAADRNVSAVCASIKSANPLADVGIELHNISVKLSLKEDISRISERISLSNLMTASLLAKDEITMSALALEENILLGEPRKMIAAIMKTSPHMIPRLLEQISADEQNAYSQDIEILKNIMKDGHLESHHIPKDIRDEFLQRILNRASLHDIIRLGSSAENYASGRGD